MAHRYRESMGLPKDRLLILQVLLLVASAALVSATIQFAKPGCLDSCGDLRIPYPFGTQKGCYFDDTFLITCNATSNKLKPYLPGGNIEVLDISLDGVLRISSWYSFDCYDKSGNRTYFEYWVRLSKSYSVSDSRNKFIAVGCDTSASITGFTNPKRDWFFTGCSSYCSSDDSVINGSCSGAGCCQLSITKGINDFNLTLQRLFNSSDVVDYNPCSFAFLVEDGWYNFSSVDLTLLQTIQTFPVVINWSIGDITCAEAQKNQTSYACKAENSECVDSDERSGYLCHCSPGFLGNPYLSDGCKDINECTFYKLNECVKVSTCNNTKGNYTCVCPKGYRGDGRRDGEGCIADPQRSLKMKVIVGVSVSISSLLMIILIGICEIRRRQMTKLREKNFKENGGLMLQQLISKVERSEEKAKIFKEDELNKATNNFNINGIIGQGGYGTVYKGIVGDKVVAIKKSKVMDHNQIEQFVNEVIILSQIKHPNVVKLIGCCLETPVPLLVYEFITNNTLHHHLHDKENATSMGWEIRLNIAIQSADALAHMHSDLPIHIIHRDIKSSNILLDYNFQAKVSDFGASRLVPLDQTQLSTMVQGTFGYIDPEYFHSGLLNEKSDVFSFGVVLAELMTGKRVLCSDRMEKDKHLAAFFISSIKEGNLMAILDERVKNEGHLEQLKAFADIARRCMRSKGEKRPTMKEVKRELEALRSKERSNVDITAEIEEAEPLLGQPIMPYNYIDSTQFQAPMELETGR